MDFTFRNFPFLVLVSEMFMSSRQWYDWFAALEETFDFFSFCAAHEDGIWAGAWTKSLKDGSEHIISGSIDDKVKIWSWYKEKLELKYTCTGHRLGVVSVDVNPQGTGTEKLLHFFSTFFHSNSRSNMCT